MFQPTQGLVSPDRRRSREEGVDAPDDRVRRRAGCTVSPSAGRLLSGGPHLRRTSPLERGRPVLRRRVRSDVIGGELPLLLEIHQAALLTLPYPEGLLVHRHHLPMPGAFDHRLRVTLVASAVPTRVVADEERVAVRRTLGGLLVVLSHFSEVG